jgi:twitching motility protein PilT
MARIDSLLSIAIDQGANELRIGSNREPKMLAYGVPKRLNIPSMTTEMVREMMGEILSPEREEALRAKGRLETPYQSEKVGGFQVTLTVRPDGIDAVFLRAGARNAGKAAAAPAPSGAQEQAHGEAQAHAHPQAQLQAHPQVQATELKGSAIPSPSLVRMLAKAEALGASDLHLCEGEVPGARIDGQLRRFDEEAPASIHDAFVWEGNAEAHLARGGSIDAAADIPELGRVRLHLYATSVGPAAAIRLLPKAAPSLGSLGLPLPLDDLALLPNGLVLLCGATGSGKSTTLAAIAQEALRRRSVILVTLEDPIEYALVASSRSLVRRRWIGRDAPDFASGLRDALREDPDIILVGEMRDPETIGLALTAAETGHLVLASIHSRSTGSAVERIVDSYPPERQRQVRVQLAESLRAVVAQRLLPRARGGGRVVAVEVLRGTRAVASLIREGKTEQLATALQSGQREGMITLERCLANLVQAGDLKVDDAKAAANDPDSLGAYLGK